MIVNRRELKYPISEVDYYKVDNLFKDVLKEDKNNNCFGYKIRSLYFDSIDNCDYYSKINGEEVRKKIRLRIYDTKTEKVKLEIKRKMNINQRKETVTISREDAIRLINKDYSVLLKYNNETAKSAYNIMTIGQYRPVVLVDYNRKAYIHEENNIRVTLDSDIRSNEFDFDMFNDDIIMNPIVNYYNALLEVKFDGELFCWISQALSNLYTTNQSLSKYCSSRKFYENYIF
ncbi:MULTISPECIES: polyphosphate polymerase domain-containing protein [Romboutsia]|uniref:VTC domain-containing protein n=1 Tax=Romboutsia hominis TaxID=1507512 RepID=A0A2P2BSM2_9FIRM|nr:MULTISPECIES: polyphosphate polymerase domain-containing protein [Romboutsia]MDB8791005.1 polyphosphate polymerase domain-containing protein [Romboutsia sp. 1001216sp1]MDB8801554.1 polyphosphate polymerase domain-containing protein [Romboutsia sp. 1001216sp1]MDB8812951.1 polyphosphate polymerase domain-containing protein [Romboutsia sp. 1001216sp1]CEI73336.1 VTC domain-containing protein [Romboutsia hominis]